MPAEGNSMTAARDPIVITPYQERWVREFREAGTALRAVLGDLALRTDHIGSTSVPGLAAKDYIDVQVTVADLSKADTVAEALGAAGYRISAHTEDHRPPGDTHPAEHWRKRLCREPEGVRRTHIHIRAAGHANQRYALLFRDFLRANPLAAGGYERAKVALSRLHPDNSEAYYDVKDPICDVIMAGAEVWAAATNWKLGSSDA
jgi:GrpB-like predicted nucleotidyltransferase (UPF0157 family)